MSLNEFKKILGKYAKVVEEDEIYFPVCSIEKAFEEYINTKKLKIPLSDEDLEQLKIGEVFNWCFDDINVCLYGAEEDEVIENE